MNVCLSCVLEVNIQIFKKRNNAILIMMKLAIGYDLVVPAEPEKVEPTVAHEES